MKNCLTFLFYFFSIVYLHCQVKVIDVKTPGSLSKLLGSEINSITELKINGKINSVDYTTLKSMKKLSVLDLSNSGADDGILPAQAFSSCNVLKSITLPASLVTISKSAFEYASNVNVDASKCYQLKNIGKSAFHSVKGKIILPDQLKTLPYKSFAHFNGTVVLPKNLKSIGEFAFYNSQINTLDLTQCPLLETIESYAFSDVEGEIILPDQLEILPEFSFDGFKGKIVLPKNLKTIGERAFGYSQINTLDLTQCPLLETIENYAFQDAYNLNLDLSKATKLKNIGEKAFLSVKGKIILPDQLEILPESSFAFFDGTVVLPKNLKNIGEEAFEYSKINILDLTQCPLLETIENSAFQDASNLNLDLSKATKLKNIGEAAFYGVRGNIILPDQLEYLPESSFTLFKGTVVLPKNLKTIGKEAFVNSKINTLDLTQCPLLETIADEAFAHASNLNLDLYKLTQLKNIGKAAFYYSEGKIILPDQLEILPEGSFAYFKGTVVLPKNLKSIDKQAFYNSQIKEINLPGSLQSIADEAFYDAKDLSAISCNATTPPLLGENVFYGVNKNTCSLKVPDASRQLYAKAEQWKDF